jgi:hypothetical protein
MSSRERSHALLRLGLFLFTFRAIAPHPAAQEPYRPAPVKLAALFLRNSSPVPFTENEFGLLLKLPPARSGEFDRVIVFELGAAPRRSVITRKKRGSALRAPPRGLKFTGFAYLSFPSGMRPGVCGAPIASHSFS